MNTTTIENYAKRARRDFRKLVTDKAHALGIGKNEIAVSEEHGDALVIHGQAFPLAIKRQRDDLIAVVRQQGFDHVVDAMAYTLFNRLCALRFMEVHDYLPQRVLSAKDGGDAPDILKNAADVADKLFRDPQDRQAIKELKLAGTQDQELYKRLILAQCNALAPAMPFLFEKQRDCSELLMPDNLLHSDSVVRDMVKSIEEADWREIEIIGWLYQFYISERKDEVIGSVVEKEDIPAATQLFTPKWIVRYMVENSLGRLWLESHPDSPLKAKMPYYIENPDDGKTPPTKRFDTPDEIKCMDDACGSGHILVYKFDLLYEMYAECGYPKTEIPALILKNNLYGLDIDERAVQLASFALMMKAREKDARFLEKGVFPNVITIQESNGIDLDAMFSMGVRDTSDRSPFDDPNRLLANQGLLPVQKKQSNPDDRDVQRFKAQFNPLVDLFHDAKNYGSLLTVPDAIAAKLSEMSSVLKNVSDSGQLFDRDALGLLDVLVKQAAVLAMKYDACVTNPPYIGSGAMNGLLKQFAAEAFPDSKADAYAMFIERNLAFTKANSLCALVTMHSWMFRVPFETLRCKTQGKFALQNMAHLGARAFDAISGEIVQTTAFVYRNSQNFIQRAVFCRLVDGEDGVEKERWLLEKKHRYLASSQDFDPIPGRIMAYWISRRVRSLFRELPPMRSRLVAREGMATGDNSRFLRLWHEVAWCRIGLLMDSSQAAQASSCRWFPYTKGGGFRRWYGNNDYVVNWEDDGRAVRGLRDEETGRVRSHNYNGEFGFRKGITWSALGSGEISVRYSDSGFLFDSKGSKAFADDGIEFFMGLANSRAGSLFLAVLSATLDFKSGDLLKIPLVDAGSDADMIVAGVRAMVKVSRQDWDNVETSWDFADLPLLRKGIMGQTLAESWHCYAVYCADSIKKLQALETENNRLFIEAYGLQDELKPEVHKDQITLSRADAEKDIKAFISYAIGCMMGRYSLSKPGLQFAGGDWDESIFKGAEFQPDPDGILPVLNDAYFEDDPTERLAEFLTVTFGKETLNENLQFVAQTLGMKGNESPRDALRRYLADSFFKDHLRTYKKRPIYWLFSSGKERAFQALVYIHRYTPATLSRMRTAYLHELQNKLNARVDEVQRDREDSTSAAQSNRLNRELIRLKRQQAELLVFDEKLNNLAGKKIAIDLDDGVKHNYGLFGDLLAEVKTVCGKDEE